VVFRPARLIARFGPVVGATVLVGSVFGPATWISSDRHATGSMPAVDCEDPPLYGPNGVGAALVSVALVHVKCEILALRTGPGDSA
jgi:hypothetical protein